MTIRNRNNGRYYRRFVELGIIVLSILPFSIATSPLPPPYYQYSIRGVLERPAGGSRSNFAVTLLGKYLGQIDTGYQALPRVANPDFADISIALTDSTGAFFIRISSQTKADSLALAAILPDRPRALGAPITTDSLQATPTTKTYRNSSEPGCFGCSTDPGTTERPVFYSYYITNQTITIPF